VGFAAKIKGVRSHGTVAQALDVPARFSHRGA